MGKIKKFFKLGRKNNVFELVKKGKITREEGVKRVFGKFINNVEKQKNNNVRKRTV